MEIFSMEGWYFLLRWFHFLAGITWIGMLYYFNLVQTPFFGSELGGQARSAMVRGLLPNALWWFRWGAMFTFLTGWLILLTKLGHDGVPLASGYSTRILTGGLLGTLMWYNVWFVIWPAQQVVIASATAVAGGGQADPAAAGRGARAGLASRTNTLFSIPMLFFMARREPFPVADGGPRAGRRPPRSSTGSCSSCWWPCWSGTGCRAPGGRYRSRSRRCAARVHFGLGVTLLLYLAQSILL